MKRQTGAGAIASLILACVFGATLLLSIATGAGVYRRVEARVEQGIAQRVGLTYIAAKIHGFDSSGAVRAGTFGGVDALYLTEELDGSSYDTILYVYDGHLRELLCESGSEMAPEDGEIITDAQNLSVSASDGLLHLTYLDMYGRSETTDIFLRSGE